MQLSSIDSPPQLADALLALFPAFADELRDEEIESYHQVFRLLSPRVAGFLRSSSEQTTKAFSALLNSLVSNGGDQENAASTCLLEHASQIGIRRLIRPYLSKEAQLLLR